MALKGTGSFEQWITDRIDFEEIHPKSGDTGDFEAWITDRIDFSTFVEAEAAPVDAGGVLPSHTHPSRFTNLRM